MTTKEFEFDAFADNFDLTVDETSEWPSIAVEITVKWHGAEPDVGVFGKQAEITDLTYYLDGDSFSDEGAFCTALYERIGDEIDATVEAVTKVIRDQISDWESEMEEE